MAKLLLVLPEGMETVIMGNRSGRLPLHCAAYAGNAEVVDILLSAPKGLAALTVRDGHGWTPLHYAQQDITAAALVMAPGGRRALFMKNQMVNGYTPLDVAFVLKAYAGTEEGSKHYCALKCEKLIEALKEGQSLYAPSKGKCRLCLDNDYRSQGM